MRHWAVALIFACHLGYAQEPAEEKVEGLIFRDPFAALSANETRTKLIVFLITDDDPEVWSKSRLEKADKARMGVSRDVWCGREFRRSFQKLFESRPDLKDRCIVQRIAAGLPANLNSNPTITTPRRALVAICDGQYRLLNFGVGVPDSDDLAFQIEDAEENKALLSLHHGSAEEVTKAVIDRTQERVRRVYREALTPLIEPMSGDTSLYDIDDAWLKKYAAFASEIWPSYLFDIKLRFGFDDPSDLARLLVLEQHCETRRNWCDVVAPYLVGRPARDLMHPLVEVTWGTPAVMDVSTEEHDELLRWLETNRENSTVVLAIMPSYLYSTIVWPPHDVSGKVHSNRNWQTLEKEMSNHPFRSVSAEELSVIIREYGFRPINLLHPARSRYLVLELDKKLPLLLRENDVPGKFIKRLTVKN